MILDARKVIIVTILVKIAFVTRAKTVTIITGKAESTKQMEEKLNFQVPAEGLELVILLHTVLSFEAS